MRKINLFIDTSSRESIRVAIEVCGERFERGVHLQGVKAQVVLSMIKELLEDHDMKIDDILAIQVNTGPGSYTGLRVGIAIANMLGLLLSVPINGEPIGLSATPTYTI